MAYHGRERRKYQRFDLGATVHFYINYKLVTKVKFRVLDDNLTKKIAGISRNISAQGLRFSSPVKLVKGDNLCLELYLPGRKKPIPMNGFVQWSQKLSSPAKKEFKFDTGVKLLRVRGRSVARSIHIDRKYHEPWSNVLDAVLGDFYKYLHKVARTARTRVPAAMLKAVKTK